nr:filamentous hemagglutinin N-terminal domain-containing protein [Pseudomonas nitroreducens]
MAVDAAAGGNTHLGAAGNGVPVVNIATPNGAGLSHNKFTDYNVGQNGLILNNATGKAQATQLGGIIVGNPNLKGGAAQKILNEVTGANPSQLRGYTEVAGQSAHVIVANPHGITCNGCGFINTPRATLTTGKPLMDGERLRGYDVDAGEIAIEGAGLNASNIDRFELITRSAKLNADLYAKQLAVVAGRNQVDAESLAATAKADDGSAKPQLAIDSSALGGMYAGAIRLVGTEQGVGVKLAGNMAASGGDIQIDANGQLSLAQTSAAGSLRAKAGDIALNGQTYAAGVAELSATGQLSNSQSLAAGQRVALSAAQVSNSGIVEAGVNPDNSRNAQGDVAITAQNLRNSGSVVASRNLEANASGTLDNQRGASLRGTNTTLQAAALSNQGRVLASNALSLSGQQLGNVGGEISARTLQVQGGSLDNRLGLFSATQTLNLTLVGLDNSQQGSLSSRGALDAQVSGVLNNSQDGRLLSEGAQHIRAGQLSNQGGLVSSQGNLAVHADALDNRSGRMLGDAAVALTGGRLDNRDNGRVIAQQNLQLALDSVDNAGLIQSDAALTLNARTVSNASGGRIAAKGALLAQAERLEQNGGELLSEASLQVLAQQLYNRQGAWIGAMNDLDLRVGELFNLGAEISSRGALNLVAVTADNSGGQVVGDGGLQLQVERLSNRGGSLIGQNGLSLRGAALDNSQGGLLSSQRNLTVELSETLDNHAAGQLTSEGALTISAAQVDNRAGTLSSAQALTLGATALNNQGGKVLTDATLNISAPTLDNRQGGVLSAKGAIELRGGSLLNSQAGRILGGAGLLLAQRQVDNSDKGRIEAAGRISGQVQALDQHGDGQLISTGGIDLDFAGGSLDNRQGGLLTTPGQLLLRNLAQLNNSAGGEVSSQQSFLLSLASLNNQGGKLLSGGALSLLVQTLDNRQGGVISAKGVLTLRGASLLNSQSGHILGGADLLLAQTRLDNSDHGRIEAVGRVSGQVQALDQHGRGQLIGSDGIDLDFTGGSLDNSDAGLLATPGMLQLRNLTTLNNSAAGEISSQGSFALQLTALNNQGGKLLSDGALSLTVQNLDNRQGGVISAKGVLTLHGASLLNSQFGHILGGANLLLAQTRVDNSDHGRIEAVGHVNGQLQTLDQHGGGQLVSNGGIDLDFAGGSLDNSADGLLATMAGLQLHNLAQLNNSAGGEVSSQNNLDLRLATLNNLGGKLLSDGALSLTAQSLDNRQGGVISAKDTLALYSDSLLNSQSGRILSGADLLLAQTRVDNSDHGRIEAAGLVSGQVRTLDQHNGGQLLSNGGIDLDFAGGSLDNSAAGLVVTPGELTLRNLTQLDNSAGGEISSQQTLGLGMNMAPSSLNNQGGRILSSDRLSVQLMTGVIDNSQAGVLFGRKQNLIDSAHLDNSAGGTIASQGGVQVRTYGDFDNHDDGAVAAGGLLHVQVGNLNNQGGSLSGAQDFYLISADTNNQNGRITAQGLLNASTGELDNRAGIISGQQKLTLGTQNLDNRGGLVTTQGQLELFATTLDNRQAGELSASGALRLYVQRFIQQQGRLITGGDLTLDLAGGDLDNRDAVLSVGGLLRIDNLRQLDNRGGEISSQNSFQLSAEGIDNGDQGKLISAQQLTLNTGTLRNANQGLLSGWQALVVNAVDLDNSIGGTLSSKQGSLDLSLSGALDNRSAGALVSQGKQTIRVASLNNQGGILSSQSALDLRTGALDNSAQGLISAERLQLQSAALDNQSGQISATQIDLDAYSLNNNGGSLVSQGTMRLSLLDALLNLGAQSKIASGGPLELRAASLDNRGGQLASQSLLTLVAGRFDNSAGGTLAAQGDLTLGLSGELRNGQDGLIFSQAGQLAIGATSLDNSGGTLQAQGDTTLNMQGTLANQGGRIASQAGTLDLRSASLDNSQGGILASLDGALTLVTGAFGNNSGITQAQRLDISASGGLDNQGGHLSAVSGDNRISTTWLANQGGGLYAGGQLSLGGDDLLNQNGQIGAAAIDLRLDNSLNNQGGLIESSGSLNLGGGLIDNQNGRLRALGSSGATVINTAALDNRNGVLETANENLTLAVGNLLNDGGRVLHVGSGAFALNASDITRAGGSFITTGHLDITADSWTNSSVLQAGWLNLNIGQFTQTASGQLLTSQGLTGRGGNWNNDGLLASDGSLDIQLTGTYSGAGRVTSLGDLNLSASQLDVAASASIAGGQNVTLGANTLNNHGRITAADSLTVNTGTLNNYATLGSAGQLRINTWDLLNDGQAQGALIFSGGDMALRVGGALSNRYADIYSLGNLDIAANDAGGWTGSVENRSGVMEAAGDLSIASSALSNTRDSFGIGQKLVTSFILTRCNPDCLDQMRPGYFDVDYLVRDVFEGDSPDTSASGQIQAGRDFRFVGGSFDNTASSVSAAGNVSIDAQRFSNQGGGAGVRIRTYSFYSVYLRSGGYALTPEIRAYNETNHLGPDFIYIWDRYNSNILELGMLPFDIIGIGYGGSDINAFAYDTYKANYSPNNLLPVPASILSGTLTDETWQSTNDSSGISASAIVQAGGRVDISATERLDNGSIYLGQAYTGGSAPTVNTAVSGSTYGIDSIGAQLPPDLAQQQVNPITLPGFSLPSGNTGLFRLSAQAGTSSNAQAVGTGDSYSFAGQSISLSQRERAIDSASGMSEGVQRSNETVGGSLPSSSDPGDIGGNVQPINAASDTADHIQLSNGTNAQNTSANVSLSVAQVQGVPSASYPNNSHKYLIETNPALTSLTSFLSSDYLLGQLGYDPDQAQKRLGDGLYEQRLIQQAVMARTGQRYIDGKTNDEALYKYLMDNAIAYKDSLKLSLGVALNAEQVAALTHDLVWFEEATVNGEKVLVPVLYLAQADGRLAPTGALIMGNDVSLISGSELKNSGTLRASDNLSAVARSLHNSGSIEAGGRLDLLTGDTLLNRNGVITGRDVSLASLNGDVLNQGAGARIEAQDRLSVQAGRDIANLSGLMQSQGDISLNAGRDLISARNVTTSNTTQSVFSLERSTVDVASRIDAAGNLAAQAGRDLINRGSDLSAGGDVTLVAGRDLRIDAQEARDITRSGRTLRDDHIEQYGSSVTAGGNLAAQAGQDLSIVASQLQAGRDAVLAAGGNVSLESAANEDHFRVSNKLYSEERDRVQQQATTLEAGGDVLVSAGENLTLKASKIGAGNEAYLVAGNRLDLLADNDSSHSLYSEKRTNSSQSDQSTRVTAVGSDIKAGGDITLLSGGDQTYQAAKLDSGNDLAIASGGSVTFEATKDLDQEDHQKSSSGFSRQSAKGSGVTDETLRQSQLLAGGSLAIQAVDGLTIDYKHLDKATVGQAIDAMVKADPNLAWLKDAEVRGDVDWRAVKELHDSYSYSHSGMGQGMTLTVAIIASVLTYGAASSAIGAGAASGSALSSGVAATATSQAVAAGWANVALSSAAASMASTGAVSLGNNNGNIGTALKDTLSSDSLKQATIAAGVAGFMAKFGPEWFGGQTDAITDTTTTTQGAAGAIPDIAQPAAWTRFAGAQLTQGVLTGAANEALGQGSFSDALQGGLYNILQASAFKYVGDLGYPSGGLENTAAHALSGGLLSMAMGGDFKTGAMAAGASEALANILADSALKGDTEQLKRMQQAAAQIVGIAAASTVNGDLQMGGEIAKSGMAYNRQLHPEEEQAIKKEAEKGDFKEENLEKAACYLVKCWAAYERNSAEYNAKFVSDEAMVGLSNELAWAEAQQDSGIFVYSTWDKARDIATTDVLPVANNTGKALSGAMTAYSGGSICAGSGGLACIPGGVMFTFGFGNILEGGSGIYNHFSSAGPGFNPVKESFTYITPEYGAVIYSGMDLAATAGAGFVKVPLAMGVNDGLNRSKSIFGALSRRMDNDVYFLGNKLPDGVPGLIYINGVSGKVIEFKDSLKEGR